MSRRQAFLWGAFGALLPEVLRFFKILSSGQPLPPLEWPLYFLVFGIYIPCAGLTAVAWKVESEWKAVWVGASLQALVATLVQSAPGIGK